MRIVGNKPVFINHQKQTGLNIAQTGKIKMTGSVKTRLIVITQFLLYLIGASLGVLSLRLLGVVDELVFGGSVERVIFAKYTNDFHLFFMKLSKTLILVFLAGFGAYIAELLINQLFGKKIFEGHKIVLFLSKNYLYIPNTKIKFHYNFIYAILIILFVSSLALIDIFLWK